jgi:hypothetical protein
VENKGIYGLQENVMLKIRLHIKYLLKVLLYLLKFCCLTKCLFILFKSYYLFFINTTFITQSNFSHFSFESIFRFKMMKFVNYKSDRLNIHKTYLIKLKRRFYS